MITFSSWYHRREESQAEVSIVVQDEVTELLKDEVPLHCLTSFLAMTSKDSPTA